MKPDFPVPNHVGIIMDGNGRWARRGGWVRLKGHEAGVKTVRDITTVAAEWGIPHLTLYAFSSENWGRPKKEVAGLMKFLKRFLVEERPLLLKNGIKLQGLGELDRLPTDVLTVLQETESLTAHGTKMVLRLALSYGGKDELLHAAKAMARQVKEGACEIQDLTVEMLRSSLYDASMPNVDLVIRTAGEQRLSGFLLWQASYAEFYFSQSLWPEFTPTDFLHALKDYASRVRRFGGVLENDPASEISSS
jgi:undecaprenyl diphosphate synthase